MNTQIPNKSIFTKFTIFPIISCHSIGGKSRKSTSLYIRDSVSPVPTVDWESSIAHLERCLVVPSESQSSTSSGSAIFAPTMKGKFGSMGAVTLEKSKLDMTQKQTRSSPEVRLWPFLWFIHVVVNFNFKNCFVFKFLLRIYYIGRVAGPFDRRC